MKNNHTTIPSETFRRPRILFVGESVSLAHVSRPAVLARWAKEAGYAVNFACGPAYAEVAKGEGLEPMALETIPLERFYGRLKAGRFFYTSKELKAYVRAECELFDRVRPDMVVGDFRLTLDISSTLSGVPLLSLSNAYWSPGGRCRFPPPQGGPFGLLPRFARERIFDFVRPLAFRTFAAPLERVRRAYGLPVLGDFRRHYTAGRACAYLDLPELFPDLSSTLGCERSGDERTSGSPSLSPGHFFLGPIPWSPNVGGGLKTGTRLKHDQHSSLAFSGILSSKIRQGGRDHTNIVAEKSSIEWTRRQARFNADKNLAYISLGSSGEKKVLPEVLKAVAKHGNGCVVVLSGVNESEAANLRAAVPELKGRLYMTPLLDPRGVLAYAKLTVCHGGSGSIYQSLTAGVPVLCLTSNPDQALASAAMSAQGAGVAVSSDRMDATSLESAVKEILENPGYGAAAERVACALERYDTRTRWGDYLRDALGEPLKRHVRKQTLVT